MKVSVLMSAFNAEDTVAEAIDSILDQSFTDVELLVMDDGSVDGTPGVLDRYRSDSRVRLFRQDNQGLAVALNRLVDRAEAPYLARMDADDVCHRERLARQVAYLDGHPEVGVLGTGRLMIAPNGLAYRTLCLPDDHALIAGLLLDRGVNPITHGSVMMRRSVLDALGEPPYRLRVGQDADLWRRLAPRTRFGMIPEPLYSMRHSARTVSFRTRREKTRLWATVSNDAGLTAENYGRLDANLADLVRRPAPTREAVAHDTYLNGRALLRHGQGLAAARTLLPCCRVAGYRLRASLLIGLGLLGPLGQRLLRRWVDEHDIYAPYRCACHDF